MYLTELIVICRFAMAHLINKCRREVILEYFGEDTSQIETSGVIEATMVLAESRERKVRNYVRARIFV